MSLPDWLEGAIDLHLHSAPDVDPRRYDDIELAREAGRAGLRAILIKNHQSSTVERAWLASKVAPEIRVFGGVVLNETVGGLNPAAVRLALQWGAKQVWMPTRSAQNHRARHEQPGGLTVLRADGQLRPEAEEILRLMAEGDAILGTAHLSPEEGVILMHRARELGVKKILVTHPEWHITPYPLALQKELARRGVMFERCFVSTTHRGGQVAMESIAEAIAEVGAETTVLSTDSGQPDTPAPVECLAQYAERLLEMGFTAEQLRQMMCENPARLLGL